ncbi:MAG: 50S ribosomal protein L30e [Desulfurococcales archaeon]|nr:50S ribosomal protein L30e [Desulfurococcales archaeon]
MGVSVSFERALKDLIKTGVYYIGSKQSIKALKLGKAKMVIMAENAPPQYKRKALYYAKLGGVPVYVYRGTSVELGLLAGKPFRISMIAVVDEGSSNILRLAEEESGR